MDIGDLNIILGADDSNFSAGLAAAINSLKNFSTNAASIAKQAGKGFADFAADLKTTGSQAADNFAAGFNTVNGKLSKTFDDLEKRKDELEKGYGKLGSSLQSVGTGLTAGITAPLVALGAASIVTYGNIQALEKGFEAVDKNAINVGEDLRKTIEIAKLPGLGLTEAVKGSVRLQAVGFAAEEARKALLAFGNAVATTGGGKGELDRVTVQLGQLAAKGKVLSQDLRPVIEAAPAVAQALQKLYGTVDSSDIQAQLAKQGLSSKEFVAVLTEELGKLPQVGVGVKNSLENLGDSVTLALAKVGESLNKSLNIEGLVNSIGEKITSIAEAFSELSPATQTTIIAIAGVAAAIGPLLLVVGTLLTALPSMAVGFGLVTTALEGSGAALLAFAANPVVLAIAGVAALAAGLYYLAGASDRAVEAYQDTARATDKLVGNVNTLLARYQELSGKTDKTEAEQKELVTVIKQLAEAVPSATTAIDAYGNATAISTGKVTEYTQALLEQKKAHAALNLPAAQQKLQELSTKYEVLKKQADEFNKTGSLKVEVFDSDGGSVEYYKAGSKAVLELQASLADAREAVLKQKSTVDDLRGSSQALVDTDLSVVNTLNSVGLAATSSAKTLGQLKQELQDLKDKLDTEVGGTAVFNSTKAQIKALEELIKKYEDTGKEAKKKADEIAKAFADTTTKVKAVDVRVKLNLLSVDDGLTDKIDAITKGINKVTDLNVGVSDARLKNLVTQLNALIVKKQELDKSFGVALKPIDVKVDIDAEIIKKVKKDLDDANIKIKLQFEYDGDKIKRDAALADAAKQAQSSLVNAGVSLDKPEAQVLNSSVKPIQDIAALTKSNEDYRKSLQGINAEQAVYGSGFNAAAAGIQVAATHLRELILLNQQGTPEFDKTIAKFKELKMAADFTDIANNARQSFADLIANVGETVATNLADVIAGTQSIGDGLTNIFAGVLSAVGGFLIDLGKQLIVYGLLNLAFLATASNPLTAPAAIAIGAAAVAAGALFKAISSSASKSLGTSGGGSSAGYTPSTSAGSTPTSNSTKSATNLNINVTFDPITLRADGEDLRAVSEVAAYRIKRRT